MKNQDVHLNEDKIIRAIVDENELTTSEQDHLLKCSICQKAKQEFEQVLIRMGDMSQKLVPSPRRRFILTSQKSRSSLRWQPALVTGFVIVLLMMGIWGSALFKRFQENVSVQKMESDQQFVAEITLVEDYALPDVYIDIIGTSDEDDYDNYDDYNDYDDDDYYDDEFLEFVLPL